jgi:hypothetical protein
MWMFAVLSWALAMLVGVEPCRRIRAVARVLYVISYADHSFEEA